MGHLLFLHIKIVQLQATLSTQHFPNTTAVASKLSPNRQHKTKNNQICHDCVQPAITYFRQKFESDLQLIVTAFKYARYFYPVKVSELCPSSDGINHLSAFPFLDDRLEDLKQELPRYLAKVDGLPPEIDKLKW